MITFFYKLFNHDKMADLERTIEIYKERNEQLENENRTYKGYKLKYEVTKLYVEDDEALLELFEVAKKAEEEKEIFRIGQSQLKNMAAAQQAAMGSTAYRMHGIGSALGGGFGRFI